MWQRAELRRAARIDARADAALDFMVQEVPGTAELGATRRACW
jgi:hypothetical protein